MTTKHVTKRKVATPWGAAEVVEEVRVAQRTSDKRFTTIVQLLAGANDEPFVRIAYTTDGVARRGPVTLKLRELGRVLDDVADQPGLAAAFRLSGGGGGA
jgi:hypothetical protein